MSFIQHVFNKVLYARRKQIALPVYSLLSEMPLPVIAKGM